MGAAPSVPLLRQGAERETPMPKLPCARTRNSPCGNSSPDLATHRTLNSTTVDLTEMLSQRLVEQRLRARRELAMRARSDASPNRKALRNLAVGTKEERLPHPITSNVALSAAHQPGNLAVEHHWRSIEGECAPYPFPLVPCSMNLSYVGLHMGAEPRYPVPRRARSKRRLDQRLALGAATEPPDRCDRLDAAPSGRIVGDTAAAYHLGF